MSSIEDEEKYSGCMSRYRFRRFFILTRALELGDREAGLDSRECDSHVDIGISASVSPRAVGGDGGSIFKGDMLKRVSGESTNLIVKKKTPRHRKCTPSSLPSGSKVHAALGSRYRGN